MSTSASSPPAAAWWQVPVGLNGGVSVHAIVLFLVAFAIMYAPAYMELAETTWTTDEQGHGPLILAAAAWLLWTNRQHIFEGPPQPAVVGGFAFLIAGVVGGLGLGCGLALLTELADTSLRRADQLANLVNAPVLSRIPYCEPAQGYPASSAGQVLPLA